MVACPSLSSSPRRFLATGVQERVVVVLAVFVTSDVLEMRTVILFLAVDVTVGPAGTVVETIVVSVTAFGVLVLMILSVVVLFEITVT